METSVTVVLDDADSVRAVCGANDCNLHEIEDCFGGRIIPRGNELLLDSADISVTRRMQTVIERLLESSKRFGSASPDYLKALLNGFDSKSGDTDHQAQTIEENAIHIPQGFSRVYPRTYNQALYIKAIRQHDIVFCTGPAGTGKSFLAVAEALKEVLSHRRRKLVLTRPIVEAGESLGFLPGDLAQKVNPYLRPLYDAMEALVPWETIQRMEESRMMEIAPLAYMRGRSLNDAVIILDEAQNTTKEQMKMFLTRIGEGSKAIITGDTTQIDLPRKGDSGLVHALSILSNVPGLSCTWLNTLDVVRNPLVKKIIAAYDAQN